MKESGKGRMVETVGGGRGGERWMVDGLVLNNKFKFSPVQRKLPWR